MCATQTVSHFRPQLEAMDHQWPPFCLTCFDLESPTVPFLNSVICWNGSQNSEKHFANAYWFIRKDIIKDMNIQPNDKVIG